MFSRISGSLLVRPGFRAAALGVTAAILLAAPLAAGPATHFQVNTPPSATAGTPLSMVVIALDASNAVDTTYTGTVHFTMTDSGVGSVRPADYAFTPADAGVHTFSVTLVTAGVQTVTATDTVTSSITGTSNGITVSAAAATHFTVSAPAAATANVAFSFTVTALDQFNNTATGYAGTVHFTSSDLAAILPADSTLTNGTGTFSATLKTGGSQTITATDSVTASITGTSNAIVVTVPPATHFSVTAPASATAGTPFSIVVTALTATNATASGYTGTVHFTKTDGGVGSALPADYTFTPADAGVHTFTNSVTFVTAGSQTVTATDTVTASITGTSNPVSVSAAAATHFTVSAPASATANVAFSFTVTALDAFNNTATGYAGTVHFTSSDLAAVLPANSTLTNGTGTFSATLKTGGSQTITATDSVTASITGTSNAIVVTVPPATHFSVTAPASATAGTPFSIVVTALTATNGTASGYSGTVHFTKTDGGVGSVLPADYTFTPADAGVHTFTNSVTFVTAGSQTVTATDTVTASITGTSNPVAVSAAAATHFTLSAPATATGGVAFSFTVTALDQFNNTATGYAGVVHFSSSDAAAILPANSTLTNGTGTFSATLNTAGPETITAADSVTASITGTTNSIAVTAGVGPQPGTTVPVLDARGLAALALLLVAAALWLLRGNRS